MNVLRKKLDREQGLPDHIKNNVGVWQSLHVAACDALSSLTNRIWEPAGVRLEYGDSKMLLTRQEDVSLNFGFSDHGGETKLLVNFDPGCSALVTSHSLSSPMPEPDSLYNLGMLDLLLFKPVIAAVEEELTKLFDLVRVKNSPSITQVGQGITPNGFELSKGMGAWNEVTFRLRAVPQIEKKARNLEDELDGEVTVPEPEDLSPIDLSFRLLAPQSLLQRIISRLASDSGSKVGAGDNPWAKQIFRSLETATVPIRVVIESCQMTVADCTRLEIGEVIDLPGVSLQAVGLETEMTDGPVNVGTAALGIYKSYRAVKLSGDLDQNFFPNTIEIDVKASKSS